LKHPGAHTPSFIAGPVEESGVRAVTDDQGRQRSRLEPHDYVFTFSFETYADAADRGFMRPPDRIMRSMMTHPAVRKLVVANPRRWYPRIAAGVVVDRHARFPATTQVHLHEPVRWRRKDPVTVDEVVTAMAAYDRSLRRAAERYGLDRPHVVTANPLVAGFCAFDWADRVTFFCRDDWLSATTHEFLWPAFDDAYRRIAASGRTVVAVSQQIIDRIGPQGPGHVLPNGVEPAEWEASQPAEPDWLSEIPHPRAIYVGTLDQRLDVEGLVEVARKRPELQVVLLGPVGDHDRLDLIKGVLNIHTHPHVGRAELVASLRNADICLLAHRRTPLTEAMSPLKVYEYLAAGCPVIATDLAPVRSISDRVLLCPAVADFDRLVPDALALGRWDEAARLRFVHENSWRSRHEQLLAWTQGIC
jgi:teichuronic acid biosynthesis glycosyltransferase TuaH